MSEREGRRESSETRESVPVLDPSQVRVRLDRRGGIALHLAGGDSHADVRVVPAFPISRPSRFVYFLDADGKELGLLKEPGRLDRESRDLVLAQADQTYFMPRITRIADVEEQPGSGLARWDVDTDRGPSTFEVVSRSESVWYVGKNRLVIRDADGNRYLIEDLAALDRRSRRLADIYL